MQTKMRNSTFLIINYRLQSRRVVVVWSSWMDRSLNWWLNTCTHSSINREGQKTQDTHHSREHFSSFSSFVLHASILVDLGLVFIYGRFYHLYGRLVFMHLYFILCLCICFYAFVFYIVFIESSFNFIFMIEF